MARYYVHVDDDQATVARELLDAADDPRSVVFLPGEGPNGAFDLPDSLADSYVSKAAGKAMEERRTREQELRNADAQFRVAPGPDAPTLEDLREPGQKTNVVAGTYEPPQQTRRGRRAAAEKSDTKE